MSEAILKLETVDDILRNVILSPEQVAHLFAKIKDAEEPKVTKIDLRGLNITLVSPDLLAGVASRVKHLKLLESAVTPDQVSAIFTMMASQQDGELKLKDLQLEKVDLRSVAPEVLVGGISKLGSIRFDRARLTTDQLNAILVMVCEGQHGKLTTLFIDHSDVIGTISPDLLQSAIKAGKGVLNIHPRPGATDAEVAFWDTELDFGNMDLGNLEQMVGLLADLL